MKFPIAHTSYGKHAAWHRSKQDLAYSRRAMPGRLAVGWLRKPRRARLGRVVAVGIERRPSASLTVFRPRRHSSHTARAKRESSHPGAVDLAAPTRLLGTGLGSDGVAEPSVRGVAQRPTSAPHHRAASTHEHAASRDPVAGRAEAAQAGTPAPSDIHKTDRNDAGKACSREPFSEHAAGNSIRDSTSTAD